MGMHRCSRALLLLGAAIMLGSLLGAVSAAVPFKRSVNGFRNDIHDDESNAEEPSSIWHALGRSMIPSGALTAGKEDIIRFLDAMDKIYGYIFAGEKTRLRDRDPASFAQIEAFLREADDSHIGDDSSRSKRDVDDDSEANLETCNGVGYLTPVNAMINKCEGRQCRLIEVECPDGMKYSPQTMPSNTTGCRITKINCPNFGADDVNFSNKSCYLQGWMCPGPFDPASCFVQLKCSDSTFYGYDVWDFYCANENLVCDGQVVANPNGTVDSSRCTVVQTSCEDISETSTCRRVEKECTTDPVANLCQRVEDYTTTCDSPSTISSCQLEKIRCLGVEYLASEYSGPLGLCESVKSVRCSQSGVDRVVPVGSSPAPTTEFCRVVELDCSGSVVPFINSIPEGCSIRRIICADVANLTSGCSSWDFGCKAASVDPSTGPFTSCKYYQRDYQCRSNCTQPGETLACKCPIDYVGRNCTRRSELICEAHLFKPIADCTNIAPLDGDPECFSTLKDDDYVIEAFVHHCKFKGIEMNNDTKGNFEYAIEGDHFAFTSMPDWHLIFKVINFNSFSDFNGSVKIPFTKEIMFGDVAARFVIPMATMPAKYMAGGRVYGELRLVYGKSNLDNASPVLLNHLVDIIDWKDPSSQKSNFSVGKLILGLILSLGGLGAIVGLVMWYRARRAKMIKKLR